MTDMQAGQATKAVEGCRYHPDHLPSTRPIFENIDVTSNSRVLVIVPHVDDEIMGCGGTICEITKRGAHIKIVHMRVCRDAQHELHQRRGQDGPR